MLVTEQTRDSLRAALREEWEAAIAEYNEKITGKPELVKEPRRPRTLGCRLLDASW